MSLLNQIVDGFTWQQRAELRLLGRQIAGARRLLRFELDYSERRRLRGVIRQRVMQRDAIAKQVELNDYHHNHRGFDRLLDAIQGTAVAA